MADIAPFRALRFDLGRVGDVARVLAPPYDVISDRERADLEARHDRNVVRLILPRGDGDDRYARARDLLAAWTADGTLRRDERPALYRYEQTFVWPPAPAGGQGAAPGGRTWVRRGFITLLRLSPFSERVVLPHEHTLSGPKADRLKLMRAARAHFSQIFGLYRDAQGVVEEALSAVEGETPTLDATTADGCRHRMWPITDARVIAQVAAAMRGRQVMIADGHHRYETMIALRDELRPTDMPPGASAADWGHFFLARAEDPGLLVLPTHRLVKGLPRFDADAFRRQAAGKFRVWQGREADPAAIEAGLRREGASGPVFALRTRGETTWLALRADADTSELGPRELQRLDVTVLHGLVLGPLLGIDKEAVVKQSHLVYTHDAIEALERVETGAVQAAFLMNATRVDQVIDACEAGFVLPQKSTYFQPKLATGITLYEIDPRARVTPADVR